jgi:hypothetical protein
LDVERMTSEVVSLVESCRVVVGEMLTSCAGDAGDVESQGLLLLLGGVDGVLRGVGGEGVDGGE